MNCLNFFLTESLTNGLTSRLRGKAETSVFYLAYFENLSLLSQALRIPIPHRIMPLFNLMIHLLKRFLRK